ncbi:MAG TPA: hypothetical protein VNA88_11300 [Candidatus Kapabacteria bacterium]|jgi:hypothetical protein|nr:hypothetical protein [Candidatus Kapabacteria bacterium]
MTQRLLLALAIVSIAASLWLGWIDYETRTIGDLFALQNIPALAIFAAIIFSMLVVTSLGLIGTVRAVRSRRGEREGS